MKFIYLQYGLFLSFTCLIAVFIYKMGPIAINGLFWDLNKSQIELKKDILFCKLNSTECKLKAPNQNGNSVNFGVYDFNGTFGDNLLAFDHYFFDWNNKDFISSLDNLFSESVQKNRWVIITIEPYPINQNLFAEITTNEHTNAVNSICQSINNSPNPVFVRWGHEMERVTGRYPWATENKKNYIDAYNYFVNTCKAQTTNAYYVWSPAGEANSNDYWPGAENVDYIGLSLYINKEFELDYYKKVRSFDEAFNERYYRFDKYGKPIIIAELGVNTDQMAWLYNAQKNFVKYPLLKTVLYFNAIDTQGVWQNYKTPDWSIDNRIFP
jgi:cellulose synthase (UDP-forming)